MVLTLVLPNYNYLEGYIRNVDQILNQKGFNDELVKILVSDDSTTDEIAKYSFRNDRQIKGLNYVVGPKNGAVSNWNHCLQKVDTEYAMFIHHDEYMLSNTFFENVLQLIDSCKPDIIILPLLKKKNNIFIKHYPHFLKFLFVKFPHLLFVCNPFGSPSVIVYKKQLAEPFDPNLRWLVDVDWYFRMLMKRPKVCFANEFNFSIVSDLDFAETETNIMDVTSIYPVEKQYLINKYCLPRVLFIKVFKVVLCLPVKFLEFFK